MTTQRRAPFAWVITWSLACAPPASAAPPARAGALSTSRAWPNSWTPTRNPRWKNRSACARTFARTASATTTATTRPARPIATRTPAPPSASKSRTRTKRTLKSRSSSSARRLKTMEETTTMETTTNFTMLDPTAPTTESPSPSESLRTSSVPRRRTTPFTQRTTTERPFHTRPSPLSPTTASLARRSRRQTRMRTVTTTTTTTNTRRGRSSSCVKRFARMRLRANRTLARQVLTTRTIKRVTTSTTFSPSWTASSKVQVSLEAVDLLAMRPRHLPGSLLSDASVLEDMFTSSTRRWTRRLTSRNREACRHEHKLS
mmetsp:Transcript_14979/g.27174  ORF Transcript_14979/g.27174 Transcript_14979/m.27174 type:complete len:316 (-) Transcript_14979:173-1120(-)